MKNIRFKKILLAITIAGLATGICINGTYAKQEQERPLKLWLENENGGYQTWTVIDEETGVNYVVFAGKNGQSSKGCSITPRLNPNGSLYLTK